MSTPEQIASQTRRWKRRFYVMVAVVVVLAAGVVSWFIVQDRSEPAPAPPTTSTAPQDGFVPVAGARELEGLEVGFPATAEGAVSAYLAYLQAMSTNDASAMAAAMNTYQQRDLTTQDVEEVYLPERAWYIRDYAPHGSAMDPDRFPLPNAYFYIRPLAVMWQELEEGQVQAFVLADEEISDGEGTVFTHRVIHPQVLVWSTQVRDGDWAMVGELPPDQEWSGFDEEYYDPNHPDWTPLATDPSDSETE
ncbi:hypothetical protein [Nocardiopsis dassonvillei]|uniref:hypothetical protein n=1 Tax=Nocardiopsis dassonvillei TaxID=2014 RepID=UPI0033F078F1